MRPAAPTPRVKSWRMIVFRTAQDTYTDEDLRTGIADAEYNVAFEIDQIDPETGQGWGHRISRI